MMDRFDYAQWGAKAAAKRGNDLPHAKLTPEKVLQIRANNKGKTAAQLADEFGVHFRTIEKIRSRETWSHI
jgi:predicted signal transduction protein with EAL and GGDEF domain